jgi:hypothetical protein
MSSGFDYSTQPMDFEPCRAPTIDREEKRTMSENNRKGFWDDQIEPPRLAYLHFF